MKKFISILGIVAILAVSLFGFTGCGSKDENNDKKEEKNSTSTEEKKESKDPINDNDSYYFIYDGKKFKAGDKISEIVNETGLTLREKEKDEEVPANK